MKVRHQLERLDTLVLEPLNGVTGADWHRAPNGKWSVCQILQHLAMGVDLVATAFEQRADKPLMKRRATPHQTILRHLLLGVGKIPSGAQSPERVKPHEEPDPEQVMAQFRMGVERLAVLSETWPESRQLERFVRHPIVGDLNLPEWVRFHYVHCRHHAKQIGARLEWLNGRQRGQ